MALDVTQLQPLNTFYEVEMGGLSQIYRYPQYPISLRVELNAASSGTMEIVLFDETGFIVEAHMWASQGKIRVKWGYMHEGREVSSKFYDVMLLSYSVLPGSNYFQYTLRCIMHADATFASEAYSGTLTEVLEWFSKKYGYRIEMSPPISSKYLRGIDPEGKTTEIKDWKFTKPANQPDNQWVAEIVRDYARSESGVGAYTMTLDTDPNGEKVMRITTADSVDNKWRFVSSDSHSNVISWQPSIDVNLSAGFGSREVILQGISEVTGNLTKIVVNTDNASDYVPKVAGSGGSMFESNVPLIQNAQEIYHNSENVPPSVANRGVRVRAGGSINSVIDISPIVNQVATERIAQTIKGTLTTLGNPEITSGYRCNVQYLYPASLRYAGARPPVHYSSGDYYINKAVHDIKAGSYLNILSLSRDSVLVMPKGEG